MTIAELAADGVERIRLPHWADDDDYLRIYIHAGGYGLIGDLYSPVQVLLGYDRPQSIMLVGENSDEWEAFTGDPADDERKPH